MSSRIFFFFSTQKKTYINISNKLEIWIATLLDAELTLLRPPLLKDSSHFSKKKTILNKSIEFYIKSIFLLKIYIKHKPKVTLSKKKQLQIASNFLPIDILVLLEVEFPSSLSNKIP